MSVWQDAVSYLARGAQRIDTQGAVVLLKDELALKIRRPIALPFLDYSTLEKRRAAAEAEIALNQPHAPHIYIRAAPIHRTRDGFGFEGEGEIVEWATLMRRFDTDATLDRLAERGELPLGAMRGLARAIHAMHAQSPQRPAEPALAAMARWIEQNAQSFAQAPGLFPADAAREITQASRAALQAATPLLLKRGAAGFCRRCHGDLHLGNLAMIEGRPTPFDAIEFDDAIATGDILYDLAFTLMDLWERGLKPHANLLLNAYLARDEGGRSLSGENPSPQPSPARGEGAESVAPDPERICVASVDALAALPLFLSLRAAIRAKVEANALPHLQGEARASKRETARRYFDFARRFLKPAPPRLVAVGGLSGSGKSALAARLAAEIGMAPGAVWLRSDVERKAMFGVEETARLPAAAYSAQASARTYAHIVDKARHALSAGAAVVLDATFAHARERADAAALGFGFVGLWLEAPLDIRLARVGARRGDASDADADIARAQAAEPLDTPGWRTLGASGDLEATLAKARMDLGLEPGI